MTALGLNATTDVSWQQPGLLALAEDDGHGDTCGPIIMLDYLHLLNGQVLDYAATDALRSRLIADKLMGTSGGMTLGEIVTAMQRYFGVPTIKYVPWNDNSATVLAQLHGDLIAALEAHQLVALETHNAAALPGNQPGVQNHFILAGGIDSAKGFLICNGDLLSVLAAGRSNPAQQPVWVSWDSLVAAQISSYAIWPAVEAPMLTIGQVNGYFKANADGSWQHGAHVLRGGILDFYRSFPWGNLNGFSAFGLLKTSESAIGKPAAGKTAQPVFQIFERGVLVYDPDRVIDNPPGAVGPIYPWHIDKAQVLAVIAPPTPIPAPVAPPNVKSYLDEVEADLANLRTKLGSQAA